MKSNILLLLLIIVVYTANTQNIPTSNWVGYSGIEVNTLTGNLYVQRTDLHIPNQGLSINFSFFYNSYRDTLDIGFGRGWTSSYTSYYFPDSTGIVVVRPDGRADFFNFVNNVYVAPKGNFDKLEVMTTGKLKLTTSQGKVFFYEDASHKQVTSIKDANDNVITLNYSGSQLVSVTDQSNRTVALFWINEHLASINDNNTNPARAINFNYTNTGYLKRVTDPIGNTYAYTYTGSPSRIHKIIDKRGFETTIQYNNAGAVEEITTCASQTRFNYNTAQLKTYVIEKINTGDQITTYSYDIDGRLINKSGNCCGYNTTFQYDSDNNLSSVTDANGNITFVSHNNTGKPVFASDALSASQHFTYDPILGQLESIKDKKGGITILQYDAKGNLVHAQMPESIQLSMNHDPFGNTTSIVDGRGNTFQFEYNNLNKLEQVQFPIGSESYTYDNVGNMISSTDPNGHLTQFVYDPLDRITQVKDPLNNTTSFTYDEASNLLSETDPNSNIKKFEYDPLNRLQKVITPSGTTQYKYDALDNLIEITDANGHSTKYLYDNRGLLIEEIDPLGNQSKYTHDGNGNVVTKTDPNGQTIYYKYDALDRLIQKVYQGNTDNFVYDANDNLIHCSNANISIRFTYDALNRLLSKTVENWGKSISYGYDQNGNRINMTDPDGGITLYEYDENDRLVKITNPAGQSTLYTYDNGGRVTEQLNHNGTKSLLNYDNANRLISLINRRSNGSDISRFDYTYDSNGNRLTMIESGLGTHQYTYDGDNRLKKVVYPLNTIEEFLLDSTGNRQQRIINNIATQYTYDAGDRMLMAGNTTFQYDNNGNQMQRVAGGSANTYEFDGENKLISVKTSSGNLIKFQYDPMGNRVSQTVNGIETKYFLDEENVLLELNSSNQTMARYTSSLAMDSWLVMTRNSQTYFYHTNGLGSVTEITDGSGSTVATYDYDVYGNITNATGNINNPFTYTGREYDSATELYYFRTRYYDASIGRFISRDNFEGFIDRPLSLNKYTLLEGNVVNYTDPTGELLPVLGVILLHGVRHFVTKTIAHQLHKRVLFGLASATQQVIVDGKSTACIDWFDVGVDMVFGWSPFPFFNSIKKFPDVLFKKSAREETRASLARYLLKTGKKRGNFKNIDEYNEIVNARNKGNWISFLDEVAGDAYSSITTYILKRDKSFLSNSCNDNDSNKNGDQNKDKNGTGNNQDNQPDIDIPIIRSMDPNEIIAPPGVGANKWIAGTATIPYTVLFENDPDFATAAAQRVVIEHQFDNDVNPLTFKVGDFGFGSWFIDVPENLSYYATRIDLVDTLGIYLDVLATVNIAENKAIWIFESIDPLTGLAASLPAESGFLPINDSITRGGEGFVNFTIKPKITAQTGNRIDAQATIFFDENPPISTNIAFNTIDADAPASSITSSTIDGSNYILIWEGTDKGAGISHYTLYSSADEGPFLPIIDNLTGIGYTFTGQIDSSYQFFVIAQDSVGNIELIKLTGEPSCMQVSIANIVDAQLGAANGSVALQVSGNNGPVTYTWSHDPLLTGPNAVGLNPGNYTAVIVDSAGCKVAINITIKAVSGTIAPNTYMGDLAIVRIFPVPTIGKLQIEYVSDEQLVYLKVGNATGDLVNQNIISAQTGQLNTHVMDLSNQPAGTYFIQLATKKGTTGAAIIKR